MRERRQTAMLLFISSEALFFGSLIVAYIVHRRGPGAGSAALLGTLRTGLFSLALFSSSGAMFMAGRSRERGDRRGVRGWLLLTAALGLIFLVGQAWEYGDLVRHGVNLSTGIYGSTFSTLTGFHGLHVAAGLAGLLLAAVAGAPSFTRRGAGAFAAVEAYWHFVDAV